MSNLIGQFVEVQLIARKYQRELNQISIYMCKGMPGHLLRDKLSNAICLLNEASPKLIAIKNQINQGNVINISDL